MYIVITLVQKNMSFNAGNWKKINVNKCKAQLCCFIFLES